MSRKKSLKEMKDILLQRRSALRQAIAGERAKTKRTSEQFSAIGERSVAPKSFVGQLTNRPLHIVCNLKTRHHRRCLRFDQSLELN